MEGLKVEQWDIGRLVPYARNPRRNDEVVERMVAAIREFGFRIPVIAKSDGTVVDGHLRLKAARKLGMASVPVALADELTDAQVKAFRLLANQSANWAAWDDDLLRLEFEDLKAADYDLSMTGFDDAEIEKMLAEVEDEPEPEVDAGEDDVPEEQDEAVSRKGEVWLMGSHRLIVADSSDDAAYERLLGGRRASVLLASQGASDAFLRPALMRCDGAVYVMTSAPEMSGLKERFKEAGGHWAAFIIVAKEPKPGTKSYRTTSNA
ncbi:MAG: ParB N-terminal domain-containing protein, partial [Mailhella sp.]|nr:ParB N-terminal domain-containing protein [Mailhella sp.]